MKTTGNIENMYLDMSGAAIVLASMRAAVELGIPKNISACLVLAENAVDANAYYPHQILTSHKGTYCLPSTMFALNCLPSTHQILTSHKGLTVEVGNTDAEGRLCLADAMSWGQQRYPGTSFLPSV